MIRGGPSRSCPGPVPVAVPVLSTCIDREKGKNGTAGRQIGERLYTCARARDKPVENLSRCPVFSKKTRISI